MRHPPKPLPPASSAQVKGAIAPPVIAEGLRDTVRPLPAPIPLLLTNRRDAVQCVVGVIVLLRDDVAAARKRHVVGLPPQVPIVVRVVGEYVTTGDRR